MKYRRKEADGLFLTGCHPVGETTGLGVSVDAD
jgi:hypothetical protein